MSAGAGPMLLYQPLSGTGCTNNNSITCANLEEFVVNGLENRLMALEKAAEAMQPLPKRLTGSIGGIVHRQNLTGWSWSRPKPLSARSSR